MFRVAAFLISWLIAAPAWAFLPGQPVGMLNPQVQPANASAGLPAVDDNLTAGGYPIAGGICAEWGHQVPCNNHYATTRASTKYVMASDGLFASVPSNMLAMGSSPVNVLFTGALIEGAATNLALWSRDLTQSGTWIAVTMTATKNAVGIDGTANSATTLTSSSAAGTILQSLTQASAAYTYTVYVKGVTVTGAIQVADYPVLTPAFTTLSAANCFNSANVGTAPATGQTGFLRCTVTATSLNPVIGFKFANSGDSIIVDFNQLEAGSTGTSPILTTSATAARNSDLVAITGAPLALIQGASGSLFANVSSYTAAANVNRAFGVTATSLAHVFVGGTSIVSTFNNSVVLAATFGSGAWQTGLKTSVGWNASGRSIVGNNGTVATDANLMVSQDNQLGGGGGNFLNGSVLRTALWPTRFSDALLKALEQ
jgi:hypothetical protein